LLKFRVVDVRRDPFIGRAWVTVQFEDERKLEAPVEEGQDLVEAVRKWMKWNEKLKEKEEKSFRYAEKFIGREFELPKGVPREPFWQRVKKFLSRRSR